MVRMVIRGRLNLSITVGPTATSVVAESDVCECLVVNVNVPVGRT